VQYDEVSNNIAVSIRGLQDEAAVFFEVQVLAVMLRNIVNASP
jgi:hypothetical protein